MKILSKGVVLSIVVSLLLFSMFGIHGELFNLSVSSESAFSISESKSTSNVLPKKSQPIIDSLPPQDGTWKWIRERKFIYVDKTMFLEKLLKRDNKLFFYPRPRRFGKSLFVQMMDSFFRGEKSLFEGTAIYKRGNFIPNPLDKNDVNENEGNWIEYPVIHLDFTQISFNVITRKVAEKLKNMKYSLVQKLKYEAQDLGVNSSMADYNFTVLIKLLKLKYKLPVVILIDEFDNPINYALCDNEKKFAQDATKILNNIFTEIKSCFDDLGIVWLTGVNKLWLSSLERGANCFEDLQFDDDFATAIGFTQDEINTYFESHLQNFAKARNQNLEEIMEKLMEWYGGYRFSLTDETTVFNPVSVIESLENKMFHNFWKPTRTMRYLIKEFYDKRFWIDEFKNFKANQHDLFQTYDMVQGSIPLHIYMFMIAYLTIKSHDRKTQVITLDYPNKEIEQTVADHLRSHIPNSYKGGYHFQSSRDCQLKEALINENIYLAIENINKFGFPAYGPPLNEPWPTIEEAECKITGRLLLIFRLNNIEHILIEENRIQKIDDKKTIHEYITAITKGLPTNYVIKVKCGKVGSRQALKQVINYHRDDKDSFKKAICNEGKFNLLILIFKNIDGGVLGEWVCIHYEHGAFNWETITASSPGLRETIKNDFRIESKKSGSVDGPAHM